MKSNLRGYEIVIGILLATAAVAVSQLFYGSGHGAEEIFGVKRGEGLLFLATLGLWFATWQLVKGAKETAERQLKAYVFISRCTVSIRNETAQHLRFSLVMKNSGQTPASKLLIQIGFALLTADADAAFTTKAERARNLSMGPGSEHGITMDVDLSEAELADLTSLQKVGIVHGIIQYVDAFDAPRYTRFKLAQRGAYSKNVKDLHIVDDGNEAN